MSDLHAITLTAPWGTLCVAPVIDLAPLKAAGIHCGAIGEPLKLHETRGYRLGGGVRRLMIHNGKGDAGMRESITERRDGAWRFVDPYAAALRACGYSDLDPWQAGYANATANHIVGGRPIQLGFVQGLVTVPHIISTTDPAYGPAHQIDRLLGNWEPRRFAWRLTNQWLVPKPFHARGMQSVWKVPDYIQEALRGQGGVIP
jgi:hypothetical protein